MNWESDVRLALEGATLLLDWTETASTRNLEPGSFILQKTREMVEFYQGLANRGFKRILDAGIFRGGSVVLLDQLLTPTRLLAFDISAARLPALDLYIDERNAAHRLHLRYGVDQADEASLKAIVAEEFSGEPLDMIVDDASHLLAQTRATFDATFPCLRDGGLYVIEDWGWAHWPGMWQENGGPWPHLPSLTQLVTEIAMACASRPDVVRDVLVRRDLVAVTRGPGDLPKAFRLADHYQTAGRRFLELGRDGGVFAPAAVRPAFLRRAKWVVQHEGMAGITRRVWHRLGLDRQK